MPPGTPYSWGMELDSPDSHLLHEAQRKAHRLLEELRGKQAELLASPPNLDPEALAAGRLALQKAIDSAQRMVESIDAAVRIHLDSQYD